MSHYTAADLEMAERHVNEAARHVADQQKRLGMLRAKGLPTEQAERTLLLYLQMFSQHSEHRTIIADAIEEEPLRAMMGSSDKADKH